MSLSAVAFVPAAPLLIPAVAAGSAELDDALRTASLDAVARVVAGQPEQIVVVAGVPIAADFSQHATWDFAGFGVPRRRADARPRLPWALGIGAWLLDECGFEGARRYVGVDDVPDALTTASESGAGAVTSIVVVADGSARRSERAPGHFDERAEPFDQAVAHLLANGDVAGLGGLDARLGGELMCGGVHAWRWAAAAVDGALAIDGAASVSAELVRHDAPYGVGYFVAMWSVA